MKRTLLAVACFFALQTQAQSEMSPVIDNTPLSSTKALWDIQFSADVTTASSSAGQAAVAFVNNEFWTSMWASDTLIRYSATGAFIQKFTIAGLSGTRSITYDGTNLYMGNATNTIYIVDPGTQAVTGTITSSAVASSRFLTYDPSLDGGAGGFWTGNFNTDIEAISMTGTLLATIPAATHTLTGMYGAAVDGTTLWVFHQGGANTSQMSGISTVSGAPTFETRDVFLDFNSTYGLTSGLAGGAFITSDFMTGQKSLVGLLQGSPSNLIVVYDPEGTSSVIETELEGTNVYPVPTSDVLNVDFGAALNADATVTLVDINGRVVYSETADQGAHTMNFDVSSYAAGVYQLIVQSNEDKFEQRVIIK